VSTHTFIPDPATPSSRTGVSPLLGIVFTALAAALPLFPAANPPKTDTAPAATIAGIDPMARYYRELPAALKKPEGLYLLLESRSVAESLGREDEFCRELLKLPLAGLPPWNDYFLRLEQSSGALRQMDRTAAAAIIEPLGVMGEIRFIGLFGTGTDADFTTEFPPEKALDQAQIMTGKDGQPVRWRAIKLPPGDMVFNPGRYVYPAEKGIAYGAAMLHLDRGGPVLLRLAASDRVSLRIDGAEVFSFPERHPYITGQFALLVNLAAGDHAVLIKSEVADANGRFSLSATVEGRPARFTGEPSAAGPAAAPPAPARAVDPPPPAATLFPDYARGLLLWRLQNFKTLEHADLGALDAALVKAPDEITWLVTAWAQPEGQNDRQKLNECIDKLPAAPLCTLRLARLEAQRGRVERAWQLLRRLPPPWRAGTDAQLVEIGMAGNGALSAEGAVRLEQLARDNPGRMNLWPAAAAAFRALGREPESLRALEQSFAQQPGNVIARKQLVERRLELGRGAASVDLLKPVAAADPLEVGVREDLAGYALKFDDPEAALRWSDEQLAVSPNDPEGLKNRAEALSRMGRDAEANRTLALAVAARPQDEDLRRYLAFREKREEGFETSYRANPRDSLATPVTNAGQGAEILLQQTVVRVAPSGLASRYTQVLVKLLDATGVKGWEQYSTGFDATVRDLTWVAAQRFRPAAGAEATLGEGQRGIYTPNDGEDSMYYRSRVAYARFPDLRPGDLINLEFREDDVVTSNAYGDYFGDIVVLGGPQPIRSLRYILLMPEGKTIYHEVKGSADTLRQRTLPADPAHGGQAAMIERRWEFTGLKPRPNEPGAPAAIELYPYLHLSTFRTWEELGKWYAGFIKDRFALESAQKEEFLAGLGPNPVAGGGLLAAHRRTTHRVHYIGIEFGVHGYQPFSAAESFRRGFGDCKDKATLFCTLADAVGEPADIVLIRTRELGSLQPGIASLAIFNHAIAYLPRTKTFVDGTADYVGLGELPTSDQGATVLVVSRDGTARSVTTPESAAADNLDERGYDITVDDADPDRLHIEGRLLLRGAPAPAVRHGYEKAATRSERLERQLSDLFPAIKLESTEFSDLSEYEKPVEIRFRGAAEKLLRREGKTLWLPPRFGDERWVAEYATLATRTLPLELHHRTRQHLTVIYTLPEGAALAKPPESAELKSKFGDWSVRWKAEGRVVTVETVVEFTVTRVAPADYPEFRQFLSRFDDALAASAEVHLGARP
jgi:tetratricopeptide (TPR) repeat protein